VIPTDENESTNRSATPLLDGQSRLGSVQCLGPALFVNAKR
jgi:hypothetical protein